MRFLQIITNVITAHNIITNWNKSKIYFNTNNGNLTPEIGVEIIKISLQYPLLNNTIQQAWADTFGI